MDAANMLPFFMQGQQIPSIPGLRLLAKEACTNIP